MSKILYNINNLITQKYKKGIHNGIDIVGEGYAVSDIIAHSNGEVVGLYTSYKKTDKTGHSYGNYVKIRHDNGYYTLYAHLKYGSITVNMGDKVIAGEKIGRMGATGHSTGIHLHFEVRNDKNVQIDPTKYIDDDLPKLSTSTSKQENDEDKELLLLVRRTIRGDFGNGRNRVIALGPNYDKVQHQVNLNDKHHNKTWDSIRLYEE